MHIQADRQRADVDRDAAAAALAEHSQALLQAAQKACASLQAAEKIVRGAGNPRTADIIASHAAELLVVLQKAAGEKP